MANGGHVYVGTSGWHYRHWRGTFYPHDLPPRRYLEFYLQHFRTVELNNFFYRLPTREMMVQWRQSVPDDFVFAIKANRYITHMKKLRDPEEPLGNLFDRVGLLERRAGPILFQLPPRWRFDVGRLRTFLRALSREYRYAFEFRDPSWFNPDAYALLAEHHAAFCIYELAGMISPLESTANFVYVRLHGPGGAYQGSYGDAALAYWADRLRVWSGDGRDAYCYFDNDEAGHAAFNARTLRQMVSGG